MQQKIISTKITAYVFDEIPDFLTYVYIIFAPKHNFIIDTFCGKDYMTEIINDISNRNSNENIIINTHFHWDHIWGNSAFEKSKIVAHKLCSELIEEKWDEMYEENKEYILGKLVKVLPNTTFENKLYFPEDNIIIFYSPGHTDDCISVFDTEEKILFAGDNLEKPQIFIESPNVNAYIESLKYYIKLNPKKIMAGHTIDLTINDIKETIKYLECFKS
ncbi:MAG: MBL fold metallo-hydrolase [Bacteroidales bacterium]|jgi:glyoxylase-like metal-dependent hydrolase (beta-lactamase superfamily II)|nr:MBL fold metallo-hydrolase [Bacteroidales bacterium]